MNPEPNHPLSCLAAFLQAGAAIKLCPLVLCIALLGGCATPRNPAPDIDIEDPSANRADASINDLRTFPQNLTVYADKTGEKRVLLDESAQRTHNARYDSLLFSPWEQSRGTVKAKDAFVLLGGSRNASSKARGYAENLLPWSQKRWDEVARNADRQNFPARADKAIVVRETPLREVPTHLPRFAHPTKAGQGFPFDLFQISTLPLGMPLFITHSSADGAWVYVETALTSGWVMVADTALVDSATLKRYKNGTYAAVLRDRVTLRDASGQYLAQASVGAILPMEGGTTQSGVTVLVPVRTPKGHAVLVPARLAPGDGAPKPLPLTPERLAALGNPLLGQPYGWGGLLGNRDCSLLLRDLFTPFGVWLPRNSKGQAKAWSYIDFGNASPQKKEQIILHQGVPFATLLWLPGHITLYLGEYEGKAVMLHNAWGIRTIESNGQSGRHILGRTVITSTNPGKELPNAESRDGLLGKMKGMGVLHAI